MKTGLAAIAALSLAVVNLNAQTDDGSAQILAQVNRKAADAEVVSVNPDLVELVVELDPRAYGYRARTRSMQLNFDVDPLVMGRVSMGFQVKIHENLMLDFPVYYEDSRAALPFGKWAGLFNENLESYWGAGAGVGLKWRLSEWFSKSSFYLLPRLKAGYYSQKGAAFKTASAMSVTPELILGWERVFDTGLVFGVNLGVEKIFAFPLQASSLPYVPAVSINPNIQIGYAW